MFEARGLMVFYENMLALNNVSLQVEAKRIIGIFGANSAGKSTLMYTLSGIILDMKRKEEMAGGERITVLGQVLLEGQDIMGFKPSRRARQGLVLCPERRRIFPESTVLENLLIGGYLATARQKKETLDYVFQIFPALVPLKNREGGFLSGGEQQMLAIGRALMAQPRILMLDEPLMGLSPLVQAMLVRSIREIRNQRGITILVSEQYARPLIPIIDYGYILENGTAVLEGNRQDLLDNPDVRSAYFGV
ncbi:MAG: ABC transporter ATP-binding protein [Desulfobacterota bacterium]|nr:ABC transporter ATP-binding protein [Thermodesulfobacteriota bacterium]